MECQPENIPHVLGPSKNFVEGLSQMRMPSKIMFRIRKKRNTTNCRHQGHLPQEGLLPGGGRGARTEARLIIQHEASCNRVKEMIPPG